MVRRLLVLLIALAIAVASPPFGAAPAMPSGMTTAADCACPDGDQDCGEHDNAGCGGALACGVQCGVALPMLGREGAAAPSLPGAASHRITPLALLISVTAAPPLRPPTASIPA